LLLRITYEIKPGIFDEKRGNAALLIENSGFYFIFDPKERESNKQYLRQFSKTLDLARAKSRVFKNWRRY